ncbi:TetR/AcrR family transcriptional regulator [Sphingopyxis fribergensis]
MNDHLYIIAMGRRKLLSDAGVLDRLLTQLEKVGPDGLSFSVASRAAGLSPATLVQRFASRDAMIEAVLLHAWDKLDAQTSAADAGNPATPAGAIDLLMTLSPGQADVADGLLLLREDIRNPVLRARGAAWGSALAKALGRRLAVTAPEIERLGWQMAGVWQGAIIWRAFRHESEPANAIRAVLEDWCQSAGVGDRQQG